MLAPLLFFGKRLEFQNQTCGLLVGRRSSCLDSVQHLLNRVGAVEQEIGERHGRLAPAAPDEREYVLHRVAEMLHRIKAHRCRHALECMCGPEDLVDGGLLVIPGLESKKIVHDVLVVLSRFLNKQLPISLFIKHDSPRVA